MQAHKLLVRAALLESRNPQTLAPFVASANTSANTAASTTGEQSVEGSQ